MFPHPCWEGVVPCAIFPVGLLFVVFASYCFIVCWCIVFMCFLVSVGLAGVKFLMCLFCWLAGVSYVGALCVAFWLFTVASCISFVGLFAWLVVVVLSCFALPACFFDFAPRLL